MEIENYLRALLPKDRDGYEQSTEVSDLNTEEACLETHSGHGFDSFEFEERVFPKKISLSVRLNPEFLMDVQGGQNFHFTSKGIKHKSISMASLPGSIIQRCCSGIEIIWGGDGHQYTKDGFSKPLCKELSNRESGILYRKAFSFLTDRDFSCEEIYTELGAWKYSCSLWRVPRLEERPVVPFGGYFDIGLDLNKMIPMYGVIQARGIETAVVIKSQNYWKKAGVSPGQTGRISDRLYSLVPLRETYVQSTLAQDICRGVIRFGEDDFSYCSYGYDLIDPKTNTILLHLKQG